MRACPHKSTIPRHEQGFCEQMGVTGLWKLLDSNDVAEEIDLELIRGSRIAIDTPIWISNITRGNKQCPSAKDLQMFCLALLRRIKKLLMHDFKPVFVLEGSSHSFKRKTLVSNISSYFYRLKGR